MASTQTQKKAEFSTPLYVGGLLFIVAGVIETLMLVLEHVGGIGLPGCGPESGCAQAASSAWGSVPGINWPVSYIGLAYFVALAAGWVTFRHGVPGAVRGLLWLSAAISVGFIIVMLVGGYLCVYCFATHIANFGVLACVELGARTAPQAVQPKRALGTLAGVFVVATVVLAGLEMGVRAEAGAQAEEDLAESRQRILESTETADDVFTGRYHTGPQRAPIRIVMFTDYQCTDCQRIEGEISRILDERDDVSLSIKHFPMGTECNEYLVQNMHPNACWAARAAEAAGMLRGNEGFWDMHEWLFEQGGGFSRQQLQSAVSRMGFDTDRFFAVMLGDETLARIKSDIDEGMELGLVSTPMIFINGEELKGWQRRGAVRETIQQVAATNPPALSPAEANDQPPTAEEKLVADWRQARTIQMPDDQSPRVFGADRSDANIEIVMWGDYTQPNCAELDRIFRTFVNEHDGVRYNFRHYPTHQQCNPEIQRNFRLSSCVAAQAAEAAHEVAGEEGFRQLHQWMLENHGGLSEQSIQAGAESLGLDAQAIMQSRSSPQITEAIHEDCRAGQRVGMRQIPTVYINDRNVFRWSIKGEARIDVILNAALEDADGG